MKQERLYAGRTLMRRAALGFVAGCGLLLLAACGSGGQEATATPTVAPAEATLAPADSEPTRGQAVVDSIDVLIMESFPVQVSVTARGNLPDGCTQIDEVITQQTVDTFLSLIHISEPTRPY